MSERTFVKQTRSLPRRALRVLQAVMMLGAGAAILIRPQCAARIYRRALAVLGVEIRLHGTPLQQPHLAVANHISYIDILVLALFRPYRFIAKSEARGWLWLGWIIARTGTIFIDRANRRSMARAVATAQAGILAGDSVLFFPEGTTMSGAGLLRFRSNVFEAAIRAGCPVQPIALHYDNPAVAWINDDIMFSHAWRLLREPPSTVDVVFCEPIVNGSNRAELAARARDAIEHALRSLA